MHEQVVDGSVTEGNFHDTIKSIKSYIYGDHRTIVFCNSCSCISTLENILKGLDRRLSIDDSIASTGIKRLKTCKLHGLLSFIEATTWLIHKG